MEYFIALMEVCNYFGTFFKLSIIFGMLVYFAVIGHRKYQQLMAEALEVVAYRESSEKMEVTVQSLIEENAELMRKLQKMREASFYELFEEANVSQQWFCRSEKKNGNKAYLDADSESQQSDKFVNYASEIFAGRAFAKSCATQAPPPPPANEPVPWPQPPDEASPWHQQIAHQQFEHQRLLQTVGGGDGLVGITTVDTFDAFTTFAPRGPPRRQSPRRGNSNNSDDRPVAEPRKPQQQQLSFNTTQWTMVSAMPVISF